jgi:hypothetical protein
MVATGRLILASLTARQRQILVLACSGLANKSIWRPNFDCSALLPRCFNWPDILGSFSDGSPCAARQSSVSVKPSLSAHPVAQEIGLARERHSEAKCAAGARVCHSNADTPSSPSACSSSITALPESKKEALLWRGDSSQNPPQYLRGAILTLSIASLPASFAFANRLVSGSIHPINFAFRFKFLSPTTCRLER